MFKLLEKSDEQNQSKQAGFDVRTKQSRRTRTRVCLICTYRHIEAGDYDLGAHDDTGYFDYEDTRDACCVCVAGTSRPRRKLQHTFKQRGVLLPTDSNTKFPRSGGQEDDSVHSIMLKSLSIDAQAGWQAGQASLPLHNLKVVKAIIFNAQLRDNVRGLETSRRNSRNPRPCAASVNSQRAHTHSSKTWQRCTSLCLCPASPETVLFFACAHTTSPHFLTLPQLALVSLVCES